MRTILLFFLYLTSLVTIGQDLPFDIQILDLNHDPATYGIEEVVATPDGYLLLHQNGCLYAGSTNGAVDKIACTSVAYHYLAQNSEGVLLYSETEVSDSVVVHLLPHGESSLRHLMAGKFMFYVHAVVVNDRIIFGNAGQSWTTDGTRMGTQPLPIAPIGERYFGEPLAISGSQQDYVVQSGSRGVVVSDGTVDGTRLVTEEELYIRDLIGEKQRVFYGYQNKLWFIDGSAPYEPQEVQLQGYDERFLLNNQSNEAVLIDSTYLFTVSPWEGGGEVFFRLGVNETEAEVFRYTRNGDNIRVDDGNMGRGRGFVLFRGNGKDEHKVFVTDGTDAGTRLLVDFAGRSSRFTQLITDVNSDVALITIGYGPHGADRTEYYVYDRTKNKTAIVHEAVLSPGLLLPYFFAEEAFVLSDYANEIYHYFDKATYELTPGEKGGYFSDHRPPRLVAAGAAYLRGTTPHSRRDAGRITRINKRTGDRKVYRPGAYDDPVHFAEHAFVWNDRYYFISHDIRKGEVLKTIDPQNGEVTEIVDLFQHTTGEAVVEMTASGDSLYIRAPKSIYAYRNGDFSEQRVGKDAHVNNYVGEIDGYAVFDDPVGTYIPGLNRYISTWSSNSFARNYGATVYDDRLFRVEDKANPLTEGNHLLTEIDIYSGELTRVLAVKEGRRSPMRVVDGKAYLARVKEGRKMRLYRFDSADNQLSLVPETADLPSISSIHFFDGALYLSSVDLGETSYIYRFHPREGVSTVFESEDMSYPRAYVKYAETILVITDWGIHDLHTGRTVFDGRNLERDIEAHWQQGDRLLFTLEGAPGAFVVNIPTGEVNALRLPNCPDEQSLAHVEDVAVSDNRTLIRVRCPEAVTMVYYETLIAKPLLVDTVRVGLMEEPLASVVVFQGNFYYPNVDLALGQEPHYFNPKATRTIAGRVYEDANANGVMDATDKPLPNMPVTIASDREHVTFTRQDGTFSYAAIPDEQYQVSVRNTDCFVPIQGDTPLIVTTDERTKWINLGVSEAADAYNLTPFLTASATRCGFTVPFWLTVTNTGCRPQDGKVFVDLPPNVSFVDTDRPPSTNTGERVSWSLPILSPGLQYRIYLELKMPDESAVGTAIPLNAHTEFIASGTELRDTFIYTDTLTCAIDPNDKRTQPARPDPAANNYTQLDEIITYTIRFQNTGNDTAFTVRLEDQLSEHLDWSTFKPRAASHTYQATLREGGNLEVLFENILLVDSLTNEPKSHGFFAFQIEARDSLPDFTTIENTAGIYFDFNKPIITNTVINTFVEALDADTDGYMFFEECNDQNAAINPAAPDIPGNGIDENCDGQDGTVAVREFAGGIVRLAPNPTGDVTVLEVTQVGDYMYTLYDLRGRRLTREHFRDRVAVDLSGLASGTYLLHLTDGEGGQVTRRVVRR